MMPLTYDLQIFPGIFSVVPNTDLATPITTEMRSRKTQKFGLLVPKTTSNSGFHFSSEFGVLELIENDINIDRVCGRLFEIFRVKV